MNPRWHYLNLAGVLVLVTICALQWRQDRALNLELNRVEKVRLEQTAKIAAQEKNLQGLADDLALFKEQLGRAQADLGDTRTKLQEFERANEQLLTERDQLKESLTNWIEAVTLRDERLVEANESIRKLADDLNASIRKFNELATNYNSVVEELNATRRNAPGATNTAAR